MSSYPISRVANQSVGFNWIQNIFYYCILQTMYGDLILADGQYGGSKGRRWKVDWNKTPQPIQIKMKCLRGVKDKLPCKKCYQIELGLGYLKLDYSTNPGLTLKKTFCS